MQGPRQSPAPQGLPVRFMLAALCWLGFSGPVVAGTVYQCEDGGVRIYSDRPCGPGARARVAPEAPAPGGETARARGGKPSDEQRRIAAWARESQRRLPASLGGAGRRAGTQPTASPRKPPEPDACADARKALADAEARGPLDFRQLRRHGDRIWAACSQ